MTVEKFDDVAERAGFSVGQARQRKTFSDEKFPSSPDVNLTNLGKLILEWHI